MWQESPKSNLGRNSERTPTLLLPRLYVETEELSEVAENREVFRDLLRLLPPAILQTGKALVRSEWRYHIPSSILT